MSTTEITGVHPYAEKFPMLPDAELDELAASIAANGLRDPLTLTPAGLLLDGRNRWEACKRADVVPTTVTYEGDDLAEFVIDRNVGRRHMTPGSLAMAKALVYAADGRRGDGRWKRGTVGAIPDIGNSGDVKTERNLLAQAGIVLDYLGTDEAARVVSGEVTLNDAFTRAEAIRTSAERDKIMERERRKREKAESTAEAERNAKIVADLTQSGSKYARLIEDGTLTPAAAWSAHREDTRKEREREAAERRTRTERYSGIARSLQVLRTLGGYEDLDKIMAEYDPAELDPPQYDREFTLDNLRLAHRFTTHLIHWKEGTP